MAYRVAFGDADRRQNPLGGKTKMGIFSKLNKKTDDGPDINDVESWLAEDDSAETPNNRSTDGLSDGVADGAFDAAEFSGVTSDADGMTTPMTASELIAAAPPVDDATADTGAAMWHMPDAPNAPSLDAETPQFDAPEFDAPEFDAPEFDTPSFDAPEFETPAFETPDLPTPTIEDPSVDVQWDLAPPAPPVDATPESTGVTMDDLAAMVANSDAPSATAPALTDAPIPTEAAPVADMTPPPPSDSDMIAPAWASAPIDAPTDEAALTEPALTEPALTEPALTEQALTEPALTEPAPTEPAPTEPVLDEPAFAAPAFDDPAIDDLAVTDAGTLETGTLETGTVADEAVVLAADTAQRASSSSHLAQMPQTDQAAVLLEILGLESSATWTEAREARASLIAQHNPDDETDPERAELAVAIRHEMNTAYAALRLLQVP